MTAQGLRVDQTQLPNMTYMLLVAQLRLPVLLQQPLLLRHTQLPARPIVKTDLDKPPIPPGTKRLHDPDLPILTPHNTAPLIGQKPLRKRMVNKHPNNFIPIFQSLRFLRLMHGHQFPNVVLRNVVRGVGAARYLVEELAIGMLYLVGVQVIFGLEVAEDDGVGEGVGLTVAVDLVEGLVEHLKVLSVHLDQRAHDDLAPLRRQAGERVVQFLPEGGVDVGGKAGLVDAFFLVDDRRSFVGPVAPMPLPPGLLVGLPLLLLRVANAHFIMISVEYSISINRWSGSCRCPPPLSTAPSTPRCSPATGRSSWPSPARSTG